MDRFYKYPMQVSLSNVIIDRVNYINDELWQAFNEFYLKCFTTKGLVEYYDQPLPEKLVSASQKFFEELKNTPQNSIPDLGARADCYFENFTPIWNLSDKRNKALMYTVFDMVRNWEKENAFPLHKGTLFYFWATTDIIHGDYIEGMILMHKALEEDRRKDGASRSPDTPAYDFVSMIDNQRDYLRDITVDLVKFVKRRLEIYKNNGGKLKYDELSSKFLASKDTKFEDLKFFFCSTILKWTRLRRIHKQRNIADDQMAPLIFSELISDLLLIIDGVFKISLSPIYNTGNYLGKNIFFKNHLYEIAKKEGWTTEGSFNGYQNEKGIVMNDLLATRFNDTIQELLNSKINSIPVKKLEADLWLCYGLRNYSAHTVASQKLLWEKFTDILQSVLNIFFLSVEVL